MIQKPIPYGKQNITQADIDAVVSVLQSDYLTQGPKIAEFENAFAQYIGCKYSVAVANGTAALHLCTLALDVKKGHKVITTPITFSASANCVRYCDGEVLFADIDEESFLIDFEQIENILKTDPRVKGIIPVDFAGNAVNLEKLREIANQYNCWIIEDSCHSPGGYFIDSKGKKQNCGNGNFADLAIFSFHPVKHVATGEGGMITTNNKALYQKLLMLRTHGITKDASLMTKNEGGWYMEMQTLGYNYRMPDMLCALGITQLSRAAEGLQKRKQIAARYDMAFKDNAHIILPNYTEGHAFHLYVIKVENRLGLYDFLKAHQIYAQVHYIPVHTMPYYQNLGYKKGDFPKAEKYYEQCLSIPMFPSLSIEQQNYVIEKINEFYK
ncbi:MAG: UDP-4-amino-4,6-dideoxy-N-acetyl-beta-L-altrosamine transaminase [Bacteroidetes bacterium]|nr:UDP-4-amino-4,6-dideoxy-N-acetyl-beta-L-altrosamine transaminase [Bacteroidota bacterium]